MRAAVLVGVIDIFFLRSLGGMNKAGLICHPNRRTPCRRWENIRFVKATNSALGISTIGTQITSKIVHVIDDAIKIPSPPPSSSSTSSFVELEFERGFELESAFDSEAPKQRRSEAMIGGLTACSHHN